MRKLKTTDLFAFCRCLSNIGIKSEIKKIAENSDNAKEAFDKGFDLIFNIVDLATEKKSEKYIYEFLSDIFELKAKEIEDLPITDFLSKVKDMCSENDLTVFFRSAVKLMK